MDNYSLEETVQHGNVDFDMYWYVIAKTNEGLFTIVETDKKNWDTLYHDRLVVNAKLNVHIFATKKEALMFLTARFAQTQIDPEYKRTVRTA